MFKIETFKDPMIFYNQLQVGMDELHLTSIPTLAMHMKSQVVGKKKGNVWIYHHFYQAVYPKWNDLRTKLEQKRLIRALIKEYQEEWKEYTSTLLRQVDKINETFRGFIELELEELPSVRGTSKLVQCYGQLYQYYLQLPEVKKYKEELTHSLDAEKLHSYLHHYNEIKIGIPREDYPLVKRIYIYSMDYMDVSRILFFHKLSQAGYEVIFRIPQSKDYQQLYKCWEKTYEEFVAKEDWHALQREDVIEKASPLKNFLEGKTIEGDYNCKIYLHESVEPIQFKQYLREHPMDRKEQEYIGCQDDLLNEYFRDEINKKEEINHFYETPLGRFINELYNLKQENERFKMSFPTFVTMLTSGAIVTFKNEGQFISGKNTLGLLNELKPYMEGVQYLDEILSRLNSYKLLCNKSEEFDLLADHQAGDNKVKQFLLNPFRGFGFVENEENEIKIDELIALSKKLNSVITTLLVECSPIDNMEAHIGKLKMLLIESGLLSSVEDQVTSKAYQRFFVLLNKQLIDTQMKDLRDMSEYIVALTSIRPSDEELTDPETSELILMKGLEHLPGMCVNGVERLYLCDLSTINMNTYISNRKNSVGLLGLEELERHVKAVKSEEQKESLVQILKIAQGFIKEIPNFIKFDMAMLLTHYEGELHLGWIRNLNPYDNQWYLLGIINSLYHIEQVSEGGESIDQFILESQEKRLLEEIDIEPLAKVISPLAYKDLEKCDRRFYYNNILYPHPIYREDFTQRLAFAHLCRMLEGQIRGKENVQRFIYPLFPQWTETLKMNMVDVDYSKRTQTYCDFDNMRVPDEMIRMQYLWSRENTVKKKTPESKRADLVRWEKRNREELHAHSDHGCIICPYQLLCDKSELAANRW